MFVLIIFFSENISIKILPEKNCGATINDIKNAFQAVMVELKNKINKEFDKNKL